ncbi:fimbrial protein [Erwinia persicina]|uniref:fimbrial protein n=1 Tax=Erwinia persicina TaxID=55211 RepID=UPI0017874F5D|nr:fimbrial protein [Erwinia persicina]MBD8162656.1 type 1 fimbrial protein [Erwinia persicina]MBD8214700.1 type 1 fimbrial protein [Erwinia persicina]
MKLNKIVLGLTLAMGITSFAHAADVVDQGHGTVTFTGSIVDAPCSIDPESIDQTVNLGQVSNVALTANGNKGISTPKNFEIKLEKCNIADKGKAVTATFTGAEGNTAGMLGMTGTAKGASIAMTDGSGKVLELGKATTAQSLQNGNNTLSFAAYLQGDGASSGIVPGDFKSVTNFTLSYQ